VSQEYDNTNTGALFKNDKKGNANWPDYRGSINVGGEEFWLNAWLKTSKKGDKYMSLSVKPKEDQGQTQKPKSEPNEPDPNDDIPF